jgi:hypothetical protein
MKIISHRGNLNGSDADRENSPKAVDAAIALGFEVEVDLRMSIGGKLYLGHDRPQYIISADWLAARAGVIWVHMKDPNVLSLIEALGLNYFCHDNDPYVVTSMGNLWVHPDSDYVAGGVMVLPEKGNVSFRDIKIEYSAICTDYPILFKDEIPI